MSMLRQKMARKFINQKKIEGKQRKKTGNSHC